MDIEDLTKKENELCSIVLGLRGTMEEKSTQLQDEGVFDAYRQIHSSYADHAAKDLEHLKRGLFIQWYSMTEPSCFTGINQLDIEAEIKIIQRLDTLIKLDKVDVELNWMLRYYSTWDYVFERFKEYEGLWHWIESGFGTELPTKLDKDEMSKRGQMGKYWNSLNQFVK